MDAEALTILEEVEQGYWLWGPGEIIVLPLGRPATIEDLRRTKLKAEIVNGEMLVIGPSGSGPAIAMGNILFSLHQHERQHGGGEAMTSRFAYIVDLPHRQALCPDVSWNTLAPSPRDFPHGAPVFAVEVRDLGEYDDEAEQRYAAKRADYFAAGTKVVWDVDVIHENVIRAYRAADPVHATVFREGEVADAEPAVPGWRFPVDELFD
jgi:Uma2 family endonuclease